MMNLLRGMSVWNAGGRRMTRATRSPWFAIAACVLLAAGKVHAQTAEEHASHHPATTATTPSATMSPGPGMAPAGAGPMAGMAGMGEMGEMGEMMKRMGTPPPKEIYPSLMALPELTPEKKKEVEQQADERMHSGTQLMGKALDTLHRGAQSNGYAMMQEGAIQLREGLAQLDSGIAARRALAEGSAPRPVALAWFKHEMNLTAPVVDDDSHGIRGLSVLHLFTMALLVVFALAMLVMYFFKMRRAAALFGRVEPDKGSSPPGSSPPMDGAPGSSGPPGKSPLAGGSPPAPAVPSGASAAPTVSPATPLTAKWLGRLRVVSIISETPMISTFRLRRTSDDGPLPFTFVPGQFLNVVFGIGGARMNRSYSISSSPNERDYVDLTIKREDRGAVSRHIYDLIKVGDEIEAGGPIGKFTFTGTESDSIVLLSAGVGITPMMSISRYLTEQAWPGEIFFIYSCRTPADYIFQKTLAALERRNPKLHVIVTMTKPDANWKGPRGRITKEFLTQAVPDLVSRRIHLCGPPTMMDATKSLLMELGVAPDNLKTEQFGAVKPAPAAPGTSAKPAVAATGPQVTFLKNNKAAKIHLDQTILELSEDLGIGIEFSCRVGTCGVCKVKMTSGEVDQAVQDALDEDDKKNGIILACQAKPRTEVTVEA